MDLRESGPVWIQSPLRSLGCYTANSTLLIQSSLDFRALWPVTNEGIFFSFSFANISHDLFP